MLVVVTAPTTNGLTTLATARAELGGAAGMTDDEIGRLISDASAICADIAGRPLGFGRMSLRQTEFLRAGGSRAGIILENDLAPAITAVTLDGDALTTDDWILEDAGILHRASGGSCYSWKWSGTVVIEYAAGFELLTNLPRGIERACLAVVRNLYHGRGRDPSVRQAVTEGVGSVTYATGGVTAMGLESDPVQLLAPWRKFSGF